jgi:hypothetical protein
LTAVAGDRSASAKFGQTELPDSITVPLQPLNDSGVTGSATLRADDGTTVVTLSLFAPDGTYPAHIHVGTCAPFEANPTFPLADGDPSTATTTVVGVPFDQLVDNNWVIIVHTPSDDLNVLLDPKSAIACGEITTEAANTDTDTTGTETTPASGVGTTFAAATNRLTIWMLSGAATLFAFLAFRVRRTPVPARRITEESRY